MDAIELTMKEMYSSRVHNFSVKGRQSHPYPKRDPSIDFTQGYDSEAWKVRRAGGMVPV